MNEETKGRTAEPERVRMDGCCAMTGWPGDGWGCPMSAMCGPVWSGSGFGVMLLIPALLFIAIGTWIFLDSGAVSVLIGGCALIIGLMMLAAALFSAMRSRVGRTKAAHDESGR